MIPHLSFRKTKVLSLKFVLVGVPPTALTYETHGMIGRIQSQKREIIDVTIDNLYGVLLGVIAVITPIIAKHRPWNGRCLGNGSRSKVRTDTRISLIWIQRKCQANKTCLSVNGSRHRRHSMKHPLKNRIRQNHHISHRC